MKPDRAAALRLRAGRRSIRDTTFGSLGAPVLAVACRKVDPETRPCRPPQGRDRSSPAQATALELLGEVVTLGLVNGDRGQSYDMPLQPSQA